MKKISQTQKKRLALTIQKTQESLVSLTQAWHSLRLLSPKKPKSESLIREFSKLTAEVFIAHTPTSGNLEDTLERVNQLLKWPLSDQVTSPKPKPVIRHDLKASWKHDNISHGDITRGLHHVTRKKPILEKGTDNTLTEESLEKLVSYHPEIVLHSPQIAPNTGTIARLCAAAGCRLHLIEPLGFEITEKKLRRAGLDYWRFLKVHVHKDWASFAQLRPGRRFLFVETGGTVSPHGFAFLPGDILVFGSETQGLPDSLLKEMLEAPGNQLLTLPMYQPGVRSLNLSNTVSILTYYAVESLR